MLKDFFDFSQPCKNIVSEQEEMFKSIVERQFGIKVKQTVHVKGGKEGTYLSYSLYVWYEISLEDPLFEEHQYMMKLPDDQQRKIIEIYYDCFGLEGANENNRYLFLYNIRRYQLAYAHGHAELAIKRALHSAPWSPKKNMRVLLDHYSTLTFIVQSNPRLTKKEAEIREICYLHLKEHDPYNIVTREDVKVKIIKHPKELGSDFNYNAILMTNCHY